MTPDEPDLFDKLRAVALAAERLDAGTRLQLYLLLESCLERAVELDAEIGVGKERRAF